VLAVLALPLAALGQANYATLYTFVTLAGKAPNGSADGTGSAAHFSDPSGVAVDSAGNVYVADTGNHTLRKVSPGGGVTTLAGMAGDAGSADGLGSEARFNYPQGVAADTAGNVYVADLENHTIRRVTPAGVVTTLAGLAGSPGSTDGTNSAARLFHPSSVATDRAGNIFVADTGNHTIRKVTPAGDVTTLAGLAGSPGSADGTGPDARFQCPSGVAVDGAGAVYVADSYFDTIRKVAVDGTVTTLAGDASDVDQFGYPNRGSRNGTGSYARFNWPAGVAVDGTGNVYVSDFHNGVIRKVTSAGVVTTFAGVSGPPPGFVDGTGSAARFAGTFGMAVDSTGNVYVADSGNGAIRKITPGATVTTLAGNPDRGNVDAKGKAARFDFPAGMAVDETGNVYLTDENEHTVRKVTPVGEVTTLAGSARIPGSRNGTGTNAQFNVPTDVAVASDGNVYVADLLNHTIRRIAPAGIVTTLAGSPGNPGYRDGKGPDARFYHPFAVAVDGAGNVYVTDLDNFVIRKVTPTGDVTTLAGAAGNPGYHDGTGPNAQFYSPNGVAVDSEGNVYVADTYAYTIRKITPVRVVTTLAGRSGYPGNVDGTGMAARFFNPTGLAVDNEGNVYVAEAGNYTIRKVTPAGEVTTLAGKASNVYESGNPIGGYVDGTGATARFYLPFRLAVDNTRNIYVTDGVNTVIRKGIPANSVPAPVLDPPSLSTDQFSFHITGLPGLNVDVECSSDLSQWQPVGIYVLEGGTSTFVSPVLPQGAQFFRAHVR